MKTSLLIAMFALFSHPAHALVQTIECHNADSEGGSSLKLSILNPGMPGVEGKGMASATEGWIGGMHSSGDISVTITEAADGGPMYLVNKEKGFSVTLQMKNGGAAHISGEFKDSRGGELKGQLAGAFRCTESN